MIKLMAMVSLLIAPLLRDKKSWSETWWFGLFPLGLFLVITFVLIHKGILSWKDPLMATAQKINVTPKFAPEVDHPSTYDTKVGV